jgi:4-hydroxy-tetrahydrodipicolinate reductase
VSQIRVAVAGAAGRMGQAVCAAVREADDMELVARADPALGSTLAEAIEQRPQVIVDFTVPATAVANARQAVGAGVHVVIGTTGFDPGELGELRGAAANVFIAPNFAIGAVLMTRFAELAAPFFESAEIIELHHEHKVDAPSGTAVHTAQRMAAASKEWVEDPTTKVVTEGARGGTVDGIHIHALRLRGLVAHQEVVLGTTGQTLTIRHDTIDRSSFMPGVLLAIRKVVDTPGLTVGLDRLLGL